ncbi:UTP--glucose-1-phosphate uridylyltransferase GalU [Paenibacillus sp. IB182496]|uniref:UTP--glucose-1-phosphate uridylyltransferase n=1 Tax=Paenibacillus sabuli TaxID=2772509 RepID=A0A927BUE2_9BACL|nr:UTP--glucose-1-phosphate uridylyltransferase GalU [Paenibacillus sabuli]MBD2845930.1 UTP--glucose-1-phosphate uridylyltransferase GalU [Paenibacillus sabuli]
MKVKKAIIPAAGLGTRFLPATKAMPKEMLPIVDKPTIQYIIEEAVASGIEDIIIVTGKGKRAIEDHFDSSFELEHNLMSKGKLSLLDEVQRPSQMADIHYIRQKEPRGLGHAIWCGRKFIGNEPFAVLLGDDIVDTLGEPCTRQLTEMYEKTGSSIIGVKRVPDHEISRYGIVDGEAINDQLFKIRHLIEKPPLEQAPSNVAIMGRYVLSPLIFDLLENMPEGAGGEIQLTDAIAALAKMEEVLAFQFAGERYDVGEKLGFLKTTIEFGLAREDLRKELLHYMETLLNRERIERHSHSHSIGTGGREV